MPPIPSLVQEGETINQLGSADHSGLRCLAVELRRLVGAPLAVPLEPTRRGVSEMAAVAQAPDVVEARKPRRRISLADVIFYILCLLIAAFAILFFGIVGGFYIYMTS
jgi:hypothetical protein